MKQVLIIKIVTIIALFPITFCVAEQQPSNRLEVESKKNSDQETISPQVLNLNTTYNIPIATYQYLNTVFTSFYNKVTYNTDITDSTFKNSALYELVSIPLISKNKHGFNVELFGNFSDPSTLLLTNVSMDQALYNYYARTELLDIYNSTLSLGAGISLNTGKNSKIKVLISSNNMPGYGSSNALLGFEARF